MDRDGARFGRVRERVEQQTRDAFRPRTRGGDQMAMKHGILSIRESEIEDIEPEGLLVGRRRDARR